MNENQIQQLDYMEALNILVDNTTKIEELIVLWKNIQELNKKLETVDEKVKNKIKIYLKERQWTKYIDKLSQCSISITTIKKETIDQEQLKFILDESQINQITRITTFEKLMILTPEARERLSKLVRTKK